MITAIRRIVTSKIGAIVAVLFLLFMGLSFAVSDVSNLGLGSGSNTLATGTVAQVGDKTITVAEVRRALDSGLRAAQQQQQQQGLTMNQYIAAGGLDRTIKELIDIAALEQYGDDIGVGIDPASVDALIARNPGFADNSGQFNQKSFEAAIAARGMTAADMRAEIASQFIVRQLLAPVAQITSIPRGATLAYASLPLERRIAQATFIPAARFAPTAAPSDAQLTAYFNSQRARYAIPERRIIRYALLDGNSVRSVPAVTPAEIQAEYRANAARYAASETRNIAQVIAGSRAVAQRIADAAKAGASMDAAARQAGLQAAVIEQATASGLGGSTSTAASQAIFAAPQNAVIGPIQVPLGWVVAKVNAISRTPARSVAAVTPEITAQLTERKRREALDDVFNAVQDALNNGASLTEVARDRGLTMQVTPALLADGRNPADRSYQPGPLLPALLGPAFQATQGETAQIIPLQENAVFAIVELADVVPSAPPPLASIRAAVVADWRQVEGNKIARDRARTILRSVEGGQTLSAAAAAAGVPGAVQAINGTRIDILRGQDRVPPEVALLFSMAPGTAKTLELPGSNGWMVIKLDRIVRGDASTVPQLLAETERNMTSVLQTEYVEMIVAAARARVGVETNQAAVTQLRTELAGAAAAGGQ